MAKEIQDIWTIKRCLEWTRSYLESKGDEHARLSAEWLLCAATNKNRTSLYMSFDEPMSAEELRFMHNFVERRAAGEPLQYVVGRTSFRFIEVECEPGVLIPRPETELLVDIALEGLDAATTVEPLRALEIGCGTGCVSCAIASERPKVQVVATDISPKATALALRNRSALGLDANVTILEGDLASPVPPELMGTFAVLVSNPPYIPGPVMQTLPVEVADYEPRLALAGGTDGLDIYRRLLEVAPQALMPGGLFACELYEDALEAAAELARTQNIWKSVEIRQDLTHRNRFLVAKLAGELPQATQTIKPAARIEVCDQDEPSKELILDAAAVLSNGGVVVMPTDSVYGIGCTATSNNPAYQRIFEIKKRNLAQTLPLLIASPADFTRYAKQVQPWAQRLADRYWPGALTLIVKASAEVAPEYCRPDGTVALRVPDSNLVRLLAQQVGPLAVTSANTHGAPAPASSDDIERRVADAADLTLAAGSTKAGASSTIVDATGTTPRIVRQGPITEEAIAAVLE